MQVISEIRSAHAARDQETMARLVLEHRMFENASQHGDECHVINSTRTGGPACVSAALRSGGTLCELQ